MKLVKFSLLISILIFTLSCEEKATGPVGGGSILGDWLESNAVISLMLTTNSDQTAKNFLNSTGEIAVTGDYNKKLKLMIYITGEEPDEIGIILTDGVGFIGLADTSYMCGLADGEGNLLVETNDDSEFEDELTGDVEYTFDEVTLNITNSTLQSEDYNLNANLNGTISMEVVNIPANTPTMLNSNASQFYEFGNTLTTFHDDSTFTSSEDTGIGDDTGSWEVVGDTLKITVEQEVEDPINEETTLVDTTWAFNYVNYGNQFILSQTLDICEVLESDGENEDDITCDDIFEIIEMLTHLDSNSITKTELIYQLFFEKVPDGQVTKFSNAQNNSIEKQIPQKIIQYLINTKRSIQEIR